MNENFNLEIISPEKIILKIETNEVIVPAFEGLITLLKDHIPLVTFLRPGIIEVKNKNELEKFYVEDGTVEFSNNNLLILSSTIKNKKDFSGEEINRMIQETNEQINRASISDKNKYILSYKLSTLREIN
ncbi:ATP synthase F1 subunit epsilon [Pelagibacteraceae bacterium]|nr:ATP synthase F1 subunit epsilon [Pelagibacteraceae bacterium]